MYAIVAACYQLVVDGVTGMAVHFHIDNQAAIKSLSNIVIMQELTNRCKKLLNNLVERGNEVTINWIPGHAGYEGNELAD